MDFMKVFDQTVREIKREVNLKVLKVPEIEQKVLDATSDEPWGPHGSALAEIAKETKKLTECQMIMNVLWTRLAETGANWRHIYKALAVIEYLIANGSERAVDDIIEHTFQISSLSGFEYVEPNGKDMGINVRKKAETISGILNDREKIKAVRDKAAATRDKYFGLSSSGVTYKSGASSFGSSNFSQYDRYGGFNGSREGEGFRENYKNKDQGHEEAPRDYVSETDGKKLKNEAIRRIRIKDSSSGTSKASRKTNSETASKTFTAQMSTYEDDFDDFDPRASSGTGPDSGSSKQVDPFGDSLLIDLMDEPSSAPAQVTASAPSAAVETDLFGNATFVSAPSASSTDVKEVPPMKEVDLFAHESAPAASVPSNVNLFDIPDPVSATAAKPVETKSTDSASFDPFAAVPLSTSSTVSPQVEAAKSNSVDPFATVPLSTVDDSDYGAFASNVGSVQTQSSQDLETNGPNNVNQTSSPMSKQQMPRKDTFQVKSGIWADSLSRGLIDLNISAPKKVSLADIGIVGDLDDPLEEKDKGLPSSMYMGRAMGPGAGLGWSAFPSSGGAGGSGSMLNRQQWGSFK